METQANVNWIKINRSILNWEWRSSPKHYSVFCYCLERAHYKDKMFKGVLMQAGSFPTSHAEIAHFTGLTTRQVRGCLSDLKKSGELVTKSNRKGTVITVKNWTKYQCPVTETGAETAVNESVKCQETGGKVSTNKKEKKEKNEKNVNIGTSAQGNKSHYKILLDFYNNLDSTLTKIIMISPRQQQKLKSISENMTAEKYEELLNRVIKTEWYIKNIKEPNIDIFLSEEILIRSTQDITPEEALKLVGEW